MSEPNPLPILPPIFVDELGAADLIGFSPSTLQKWRHFKDPGAPAFVRVGRSVRYRVADLEEWAAAQGDGGRA